MLVLGRPVGAPTPFQLAPEALRTHAIVVGMTGSGKTGLSLVLLEELARAGVPVVAIDPKGDLGNLALLFPSLAESEFAPWVEGTTAAEAARAWREGLARWGLSAEDVRSLRERLDLRLLTPGSEAGDPVDVLGAFRRPEGGEAEDAETRRLLITGTVTGLLGLAGRATDPVRDPAHIVLAQILDQAWSRGEDPDLEHLVLKLVDPPFTKVGVLPVDRFFPPDQRMELAMALNAVLASPGFAAWTGGVPLDLPSWLPRAEENGGRARVNVVTLAHLGEEQRQFFLSILLGRMLAWSRTLPGTTGLRAVLFFDEVAGFIPPHPANPATKEPLLTMMKQARAVGVGVVLATQNPVDIDYKGIANAGLWCIGRLQTRQDRDRLLKGMGRPDLDGAVEGLQKRQFLIQDASRPEPTVIESRHALCYLRGPFTRAETARARAGLAPVPTPPPPPAGRASVPPAADAVSRGAAPVVDDGLLPAPPPSPGDAWFLDPRMVFHARLGGIFERLAEPHRPDGRLVWRPAVLAELVLRFDEARAGFVEDVHEWRVWFPLHPTGPEAPRKVDLVAGDLLLAPPEGGRFAPLPPWIDEKKKLAAMEKRVVEDLIRTETRGLYSNPALKLYARAGESREAFDARCRAAVEERVDAALADRRERFQQAADRLEDQIRAAEARLAEAEGVARARQTEEVVNLGATVLSWFTGRTRSVSTAVSKRRQAVQANHKVERHQGELARLREKAFDLERSLEAELEAVRAKEEKALQATVELPIRLQRGDIDLRRFGILWVPVTRRI